MDGTQLNVPTEPVDPVVRRKPMMAIRFGRGRTGGTTIVDTLIQLAREKGRVVVIADGDLRNSTLARLYPPGTQGGALQPPSDDLLDMKDWFTEAIGTAIEQQAEVVPEIGTGG